MRYYDFIIQFEGIEHPYGDLACYIKSEVKSSKNPDKLLDIFEGDSFSAIYNHFSDLRVSTECMDTVAESWAAYRQSEKKGISDPLPSMILYQLSQATKGLEHLDRLNDIYRMLKNIGASLAGINRMYDKMTVTSEGEAYLRITGNLDTFEQN